MESSRDRIAPNYTIRHPVWPIVALQRQMRFSARLAGFSRIRWHQRRARRAERASFSVFVSNLDFRVPSLRQTSCNRSKGASDLRVARRLAEFEKLERQALERGERGANLGHVLAKHGGAKAAIRLQKSGSRIESDDASMPPSGREDGGISSGRPIRR